MRWCYHLDTTDHDAEGVWTPRVVFADGMVRHSLHRIKPMPYDDAMSMVHHRNWWAGISKQDYDEVMEAATQHNPSLTEDGYWEGGEQYEVGG